MAKGAMLLTIFAAPPAWRRRERGSLDSAARQGVQLTIYNSEDLTLVRETRTVSFKPGANPLQFSWATR